MLSKKKKANLGEPPKHGIIYKTCNSLNPSPASIMKLNSQPI